MYLILSYKTFYNVEIIIVILYKIYSIQVFEMNIYIRSCVYLDLLHVSKLNNTLKYFAQSSIANCNFSYLKLIGPRGTIYNHQNSRFSNPAGSTKLILYSLLHFIPKTYILQRAAFQLNLTCLPSLCSQTSCNSAEMLQFSELSVEWATHAEAAIDSALHSKRSDVSAFSYSNNVT